VEEVVHVLLDELVENARRLSPEVGEKEIKDIVETAGGTLAVSEPDIAEYLRTLHY
jgi:hypothetical protein